MKRCSTCGKTKTLEAFHKDKYSPDGRMTICAKCDNKRSNKYYTQHRKAQIDRVGERRRQMFRWLQEYKEDLSCIRCGEGHPACLDFHHRDETKKEMGIRQTLIAGWGKEHILQEIMKCDVLCANCHRKLHWEERTGNYRYYSML